MPGTFAKRVRELIEGEYGTRYRYYQRRPRPSVAISTLKQWTNGRRSVPVTSSLEKFAKEWEVTLDWLVSGVEPRTRGLQQTEADLATNLRTYLLASLRPTRTGKSRGFLEHTVPEGDALLTYVAHLVDARVAEAERASHDSAKLLWYGELAKRIRGATSREAQKAGLRLANESMVELFQAAQSEDFAEPGSEAQEVPPEPSLELFRPDREGEARLS